MGRYKFKKITKSFFKNIPIFSSRFFFLVVFKDAHHDHNLCRAFAMDLAGRGFNLVLLGRDGGEDRARMLAGEAGEQRDPYRYMGPEKAYVGTGKRAW